MERDEVDKLMNDGNFCMLLGCTYRIHLKVFHNPVVSSSLTSLTDIHLVS